MQTGKSQPTTNVLIVDKESNDESSLNLAIPDLLYRFKKAPNLEDALEALRVENYPIVLLKLEKEDMDALRLLKHKHHDVDIIAVLDAGDQSNACEALDAGATDYLLTPFSSDILHAKIKVICEMRRKDKELLMLRQHVAMNFAFDNFVGLSPSVEKIRRTAQQVSPTDVQVILSGPVGTGRNLLARIIHYHSARRDRPFVLLDCSTMPNERIKAELFGEDISDGNADSSETVFKRAESGTVFLHELQVLELPLQLRLAQLFDELHRNSTRPRTDNWTDFRLVISLNEPLHLLTGNGVINEALARAFNAVEINVPSLENRIEDIDLLAAYFLRKITFDNDSAPLAISPAALEKLKQHNWPGNVRELENCLRRASALCRNNCVDENDIAFVTVDKVRTAETNPEISGERKAASLAESQKQLISRALIANNWNYTHTAQQLGIGRTTLWRKVRKFDLKKDTAENLQKMGVMADE